MRMIARAWNRNIALLQFLVLVKGMISSPLGNSKCKFCPIAESVHSSQIFSLDPAYTDYFPYPIFCTHASTLALFAVNPSGTVEFWQCKRILSIATPMGLPPLVQKGITVLPEKS